MAPKLQVREGRLLVFGSAAMFELSPECAPKQTVGERDHRRSKECQPPVAVGRYASTGLAPSVGLSNLADGLLL
jgi:hypothetical protein